MTDFDKAEIRSIVNEVVAAHVRAIAEAMAPVVDLLEEMRKSLGLVVDGQSLVERTLAGAFDRGDDHEPWRESLGDDSGN